MEVSTPTSHFLRQIIAADMAKGTYAKRRFAGSPGSALHHAHAPLDTAKIRTRFPPEPNGYLHVGHAKSIFLNFGLAKEFGGICHLRMDDTNPEKENEEFANAIVDVVHWLGFDWQVGGVSHFYHASDYFEFMHQCAYYLIDQGLAYVDQSTPEEMRAMRGDFGKPGVASRWRDTSPEENRVRFAEMTAGQYPDGAMVLRAKIDLANPNINLRDPTIYRIRHAAHHRAGDKWCVYPMYTFAHPIEDAVENITHSICTLEFEDQRPFYDWLLEKLCAGGLIQSPPPRQYEFARLNLNYVVTSKRKLARLVSEGHVDGWDDPRMPTLVGLRRRGYTKEALGLFCDRIGVSKENSWIDDSVLEGALRDTLEPTAPRAIGVIDPIRLVLTNWEEVMGDVSTFICQAPSLPGDAPAVAPRELVFAKDLWIDRDDYQDPPPRGYHRLYPGNRVRLKYAYAIECERADVDASGRVQTVYAKLIPDTQSGTPGAAAIKVKGVVTWLAVCDAVKAQVRYFERLFMHPTPDATEDDFVMHLNPSSQTNHTAWIEKAIAFAKPGQHFQLERLGYFVTDLKEHSAEHCVLNRAVPLKASWKA